MKVSTVLLRNFRRVINSLGESTFLFCLHLAFVLAQQARMCSYNINAFRNKAANKSSAGECVPCSDTDVLFIHAKIIKGLKPPEINILHQNDAEMILITPFTSWFYHTKSFSAVSLSATVAINPLTELTHTLHLSVVPNLLCFIF